MMRRLSYRLSNYVVWESQKFSIIRKKTRHSVCLFSQKIVRCENACVHLEAGTNLSIAG